jgi:hypothetical protein
MGVPLGGSTYGITDFFLPLDDINGEERQLVKSFGQGIYRDDPVATNYHWRLRMCLATGLAIMDCSDFRVWRNALPTQAIDLLAEWEEVLGLSVAPRSFTYEDRWARLQTRCLYEFKGADAKTLAHAVAQLIYRHLYSMTYEEIEQLFIDTPTYDKYIVSESDTEFNAPPRPLSSEYNRYEVAIIVPVAVYNDTVLWKELCQMRDRMSPAYVRIAINVTSCDRISGGRRPFFKWGVSRWGRDCWGTGINPSP